MLLLLLQTLWLGLPAAVSNIAPPIATKLFPKLSYPLDFHRTFRGKRILGNNKTIRGLIAGLSLGEITFLIQQSLSASTAQINILPYAHLPWFFGFLFGLGALGGDAAKSFFKRQCGIPAGILWFPFDQLDWVLGTLLLLYIFVPIPLSTILLGLILGLLLHMLVKFVGYLVGIDTKPI